jgi:hypothetical protein
MANLQSISTHRISLAGCNAGNAAAGYSQIITLGAKMPKIFLFLISIFVPLGNGSLESYVGVMLRIRRNTPGTRAVELYELQRLDLARRKCCDIHPI